MTALLGVVGIMAISAAACGSDDKGTAAPTSSPAAATSVADATTTAPATGGSTETTGLTATTVAGGSSTPATADAQGKPELNRPLKVTSIGYANEITLLWAVDKGLFEKHGITVDRVTVGGGSAAIAAVTTGAVDIGFTNGLSAIQAYAQGFPLKVVLGAYENAYPTDPKTGRAAIANVKSGVEKPCDLEGKKVGVTELGNIGYQYWLAWLREKGCNVENVNFVTIPAGQIAAALESRRIDAMETGGNAVQDLVNRGIAKRIGDPMGETTGRTEYAMYIANNDFISKNPNELKAFAAAMNESLAQISDPKNLDEATALAAKFANTTVELLKSSQQEKLDTVVDPDIMTKMEQVLVDNGVLKKAVDISGLIYTP
ncbi:MAG: NrtA/SsuA/CpmA family ABC transporter substrate-binding protein [Ilumatobacteraceae bacterium]